MTEKVGEGCERGRISFCREMEQREGAIEIGKPPLVDLAESVRKNIEGEKGTAVAQDTAGRCRPLVTSPHARSR